MKHLKCLKYMLATWAFNAMSSCCLNEYRLVIVELNADTEVDGGAWSSSWGSSVGNSLTGQLHTMLTLSFLLEYP
jgi:hypothetical protein